MNQFTLLAVAAFFSSSVLAQEMTVVMTDLSSGQSVGTVTLTDSEYGTVFTPQLTGLPAGLHGFHVHANGSCETSSKDGKTVLGGAAGGHYDPQNTGKHGKTRLSVDQRQSLGRSPSFVRGCARPSKSTRFGIPLQNGRGKR